jgi:hypothetical protein
MLALNGGGANIVFAERETMTTLIEDIYKNFEVELKKISDKSISEVVAEYIPYAVRDFEGNAYHVASEMVKEFLEGKQPVSLLSYNYREVRDKIFEDHKEEVIKAIGKDKDELIESLQNRLKNLIESTSCANSVATATNTPSTSLEYNEWTARPCSNFDRCPVPNKNLHCYISKPCFK